MQDWIKENYTWIFSGIGVTVISFTGFIFRRIFSRKNNKSLGEHNMNILVKKNRDSAKLETVIPDDGNHHCIA